jgi:hypothetical protein
MKTTNINPHIINANNRIVRIDGQSYLIRSQTLGKLILADAEPIPQGGKPINLFDRTVLSKALRAAVKAGIYS